MIGSLRGKLLLVENQSALIEVAGVGYEVEMPASALTELKQGDEVFVYIQHVVREDAELLYGFPDVASRALFRVLIKVSGVGPKMAIAVLSTFDVTGFIGTVLEGNSRSLQNIPGVGKKTAERLVVELKDRLKDFAHDSGTLVSSENHGNDNFTDAVAALCALGYRENDAVRFAKSAYRDGMTTEQLIVDTLALFSKNKV